jgi:hypothetical protein
VDPADRRGGIGIRAKNQRRLAGPQQPLDLLLQTPVGFGLLLMLADVIEPGVEHEGLTQDAVFLQRPRLQNDERCNY